MDNNTHTEKTYRIRIEEDDGNVRIKNFDTLDEMIEYYNFILMSVRCYECIKENGWVIFERELAL